MQHVNECCDVSGCDPTFLAPVDLTRFVESTFTHNGTEAGNAAIDHGDGDGDGKESSSDGLSIPSRDSTESNGESNGAVNAVNGRMVRAVHARFALLLALNSAVEGLLPLVDVTVQRPASMIATEYVTRVQ